MSFRHAACQLSVETPKFGTVRTMQKPPRITHIYMHARETHMYIVSETNESNMLHLWKKKNQIVEKAQRQLKSAIPTSLSILSAEITYIESLEMQESDLEVRKKPTRMKSAELVYPMSRAIRVLKAAANVHLKIKLDKPSKGQSPLLKYLNPSDENGFSAVCLRIVEGIRDENVAELHLVELRALYIYLLSRLA